MNDKPRTLAEASERLEYACTELLWTVWREGWVVFVVYLAAVAGVLWAHILRGGA